MGHADRVAGVETFTLIVTLRNVGLSSWSLSAGLFRRRCWLLGLLRGGSLNRGRDVVEIVGK